MVADFGAVLLGVAVGVPVSLLFFAGLAWGMRLALRATQPEAWLLLSAACRIALLLGVGSWLAASGINTWSLAGYALAFFLVRLIAVRWAKAGQISAIAEQEKV
jgi:F1F0 ATPase subunit 2